MEQLQFEFKGKKVAGAPEHALAGVVSSGNLEVLIEKTDLGGSMRVVVNTAAMGFGETWRAVLADFAARHPLADVIVTINDAGATPAVVSLRLDQAVEEFEGDAA